VCQGERGDFGIVERRPPPARLTLAHQPAPDHGRRFVELEHAPAQRRQGLFRYPLERLEKLPGIKRMPQVGAAV